MNLKELVWFLCAVALSNSKEIYLDDHGTPYAYSEVYRSFDSPAITTEGTKSDPDQTATSTVDPTAYLSNPFLKYIFTQQGTETKTNEAQIASNNDQQAQTATGTTAASSTTPGAPIASSTEAQVTTTPGAALVQTSRPSPPLNMPIKHPDRLITPGLSAYATSNDEAFYDVVDDSCESHDGYEGFSSW